MAAGFGGFGAGRKSGCCADAAEHKARTPVMAAIAACIPIEEGRIEIPDSCPSFLAQIPAQLLFRHNRNQGERKSREI